jgi:protein TonB
MPDMAPPETSNARPTLPPPLEAPRIDPATLDLPELQQMTPPDIQRDTALASSERPDRKPVRAAPKAEPARQAPAQQTARQTAPARTTAPAAQTAPAARQRAGQGGERQAASQGGGGGGVSAQTRASLTQQWGAQINQRISRQLARVGGTSGRRATMQIVIARNGRIQSVSLLSSTGDARLDQDILRAAQRTGSVPPAPAGLTDPTYTFSQVFRLR